MHALFALLGAGVGVGLLALVSGLRPRPRRPRAGPRQARARKGMSAARLAGVLATAAVVGAATRWPVGAVLAAVAAWRLPAVLGPDRAQRRTLDRVEAIAAWAEDFAGTLRSAAGIEQAILTTAECAPAQIRGEVQTLATALRSGVRLPTALWAFADDLADPTADLVVNVLLQAAQYQARDIATGLSGVGRRARRHASARMRIATGRARTRTATRIVILTIGASTTVVLFFFHNFLGPYRSALGQLILAVLGAAFGAFLAWMVRTGRIPDMPRILTNSCEFEEVSVP